MAIWLKASGEREEVQPANAGAKKPKFKLEELQRYVGGYIERVRLPKHRNMIVNEEGRLRGLRYNAAASDLAQQTIVGDVLICEPGEM